MLTRGALSRHRRCHPSSSLLLGTPSSFPAAQSVPSRAYTASLQPARAESERTGREGEEKENLKSFES